MNSAERTAFQEHRAAVLAAAMMAEPLLQAGQSAPVVNRALIAEGHSAAAAKEALSAILDAETGSVHPDMPAVILPHGQQSITDTGRALGRLLDATERYFIRGGSVAKLACDSDGLPRLDEVKPAALASDFETVAHLCKVEGVGEDGQPQLKATTCSHQTATLIAASAAFREALPPIHVLTRCPVLIERAGSLIQVSGYDRASGIFAAGNLSEPMLVEAARNLLSEMLEGFRFATPADRARALAALVTPALVFGGLLKGRAPVDLGEADASQTGKGFRNKLTAAIYAQGVRTVTQQKGGTGSLEESFNAALIRGANFVALDNVRGRIDSPAFESFLTEDTYSARMPYREPVEIDPRRVVIMLTSNKADVTVDLANRSSCVRILKQPDGHTFKPYPEGDILEHVRAAQPRYLGAVFAIVRAWYDAGKPKTTETRHDFRPWAQTLDWIVRNLLDAGPLLDGHRETQARMTNPVLNWLRDVSIEVLRARQTGAWLRAGDLLDLIAETTIETPGLSENGNLTDPETRKAAQQQTGRKLGLCFKAGDTVTLDGMMIERLEHPDLEGHPIREYRFTLPADSRQPIAEQSQIDTQTPVTRAPEQAEMTLSRYCPASRPADKPANKVQCSASPANTSLMPKHSDTPEGGERAFVDSMGNISGIAGNPEIEEGEFV